MLLNCDVWEDSWESLGLQGDPVQPKGDQSWVFIGGTDVEAETPILWPPDWLELTHLKWPWCWERLRAGGEGDHRGWDGWMALSTQWTWVWVDSGSWWWTGRPGVLPFMGLQRVRHDWMTGLNWAECLIIRISWDECVNSCKFKRFWYRKSNKGSRACILASIMCSSFSVLYMKNNYSSWRTSFNKLVIHHCGVITL